MNKNTIEFEWIIEPITIGTTVYVRSTSNLGEVFSSEVNGYKINIERDKASGGNLAVVQEYILPELCLSDETDSYAWLPQRVYMDEKIANEEAKFTKVIFSNEDYTRAIGVTSDGMRSDALIDESELHPCCANISVARDLLIKCQKQEGLEKWDINYLIDNLHGHQMRKCSGILPKILEALGIKCNGLQYSLKKGEVK